MQGQATRKRVIEEKAKEGEARRKAAADFAKSQTVGGETKFTADQVAAVQAR